MDVETQETCNCFGISNVQQKKEIETAAEEPNTASLPKRLSQSNKAHVLAGTIHEIEYHQVREATQKAPGAI